VLGFIPAHGALCVPDLIRCAGDRGVVLLQLSLKLRNLQRRHNLALLNMRAVIDVQFLDKPRLFRVDVDLLERNQLARQIQSALQRLGNGFGHADGNFGRAWIGRIFRLDVIGTIARRQQAG